MVKLLRKYNKYILVVGGSLLMIAFLVPQAFNSLIGDPGRRAYAMVGDDKITLTDHERFQREFSALDAYSPGLLRGELKCDTPDHWILLTKEADAAGLIAEAGDGSTWTELNTAMETATAAQIAQALYGQQAQAKLADPEEQKKCLEIARRRLEETKASAAGQNRLTPTEFNQVLAKARGVFRLRNAFVSAPRFSDRRATVMKAERFEGAVIESLPIPAERIAFAMPEPSAEEVAAQFAKYRDVKPGTGDMGFGYRLNPRLKLEWITIDRAAIEKAVPTDAVEANKRWRNNRAKYPGEFAAEQARIETEIRNERVDKIAADIDVLVRGEFKRAAARLESEGQFKKLPADWADRRPKLEDVAQSVVKSVKDNTGIEIPLPSVTVHSSKWLTETDLYPLPGIGAAAVSLGAGRSVPFPALAFVAKEFNRTDLGDVSIGLQVGLTSGDLVAVDKNARYYFTITDFRPESAADSIDEVRDRCIEDLKKLKAYDRLKESLPVYEALAAKGLEEVKKTIDAEYPLPARPEPKPGERQTGPDGLQIAKRQFLPRFVSSGSSGESPELRAKVFAIADKLDPTKPVANVPLEERTVGVANPSTLSIQLAQVVGLQPATFEVIRAMGEDRVDQVQRQQILELTSANPGFDPYTYDALKGRWKYRIETPSDTAPIHMPSPKRN